MSTCSVHYKLNAPGKDYSKLYKALRDLGGLHIPESLWLVPYEGKTTELRDHLKQFIDSNDDIFVSRLTGEAAWRLKDTSMDDKIKNLLQAKAKA